MLTAGRAGCRYPRAPVYDKKIRDAHDFLEEKLVDLSGEFYEPEPD